MKVTVYKTEKESNERVISRFNKKVQASRKVLLIKGQRYRKKPTTKRHARKSAIMRDRYRKAREKSRFY